VCVEGLPPSRTCSSISWVSLNLFLNSGAGRNPTRLVSFQDGHFHRLGEIRSHFWDGSFQGATGELGVE
jgi:hypothetical protein